MRTGRLSISRGHRQETAAEPHPPAHLALVPQSAEPGPAAEPETAPPSPDYQAVGERLTALERLVRLYEHGALSPEEFTAEKMLILGIPAGDHLPRAVPPVHFVPVESRRRARGPSLLGRMLSWPFLLLALAAGIAFSFAAQPDATARFAAQLYRAVIG